MIKSDVVATQYDSEGYVVAYTAYTIFPWKDKFWWDTRESGHSRIDPNDPFWKDPVR